MDADYFRLMFDYGWWARDRLFQAAEGMSDEEWRAPNGFTYGSIAAILRHTMQAERGWSISFRGEPRPPRPPAPPQEPSMAEVLGEWQAEEARMRPWLLSLTDQNLQNMLPPLRGPAFAYWQAMSHVNYHSMQHRSEAAEALTQIGRSPGEIDFIFFLMETGRVV